jgi:hypothetical protein
VIPGSNQLEIEAAGDGIFRVVLPSKADMARLRKINDLKLENYVFFLRNSRPNRWISGACMIFGFRSMGAWILYVETILLCLLLDL